MVVHAYNPRILGERRSEVHGHLWLQSEYEISLGHTRLCLKIKEAAREQEDLLAHLWSTHP